MTMRIPLDVQDFRGRRLFGVVCKRAGAPRVRPSIRIALEDLRLERVVVIYPGTKRFALADRVEAVPLDTLAEPGRLLEASVRRPKSR